jgi:hypothetical protein
MRHQPKARQTTMPIFPSFFSLDSSKAIKAREYGYLNAINYMAPHTMAGHGNVCGNASAGCIALCLGWFSGQAGMVRGNRKRGTNSVRKSRISKVKMFMHDRSQFLSEMIAGIKRAEVTAKNKHLNLCVRLNGSSDIAWEGVRLANGQSVFEAFAQVQFVDYTKSFKRALKAARGEMPKNYHLTFSRSETNEADCVGVLKAGGTVAAVFADELPKTYLGYPVINGDKHDLRHLDPPGVVIGLSPKGSRAKKDKSGFVVR